jgi:hypothetical protein
VCGPCFALGKSAGRVNGIWEPACGGPTTDAGGRGSIFSLLWQKAADACGQKGIVPTAIEDGRGLNKGTARLPRYLMPTGGLDCLLFCSIAATKIKPISKTISSVLNNLLLNLIHFYRPSFIHIRLARLHNSFELAQPHTPLVTSPSRRLSPAHHR